MSTKQVLPNYSSPPGEGAVAETVKSAFSSIVAAKPNGITSYWETNLKNGGTKVYTSLQIHKLMILSLMNSGDHPNLVEIPEEKEEILSSKDVISFVKSKILASVERENAEYSKDKEGNTVKTDLFKVSYLAFSNESNLSATIDALGIKISEINSIEELMKVSKRMRREKSGFSTVILNGVEIYHSDATVEKLARKLRIGLITDTNLVAQIDGEGYISNNVSRAKIGTRFLKGTLGTDKGQIKNMFTVLGAEDMNGFDILVSDPKKEISWVKSSFVAWGEEAKSAKAVYSNVNTIADSCSERLDWLADQNSKHYLEVSNTLDKLCTGDWATIPVRKFSGMLSASEEKAFDAFTKNKSILPPSGTVLACARAEVPFVNPIYGSRNAFAIVGTREDEISKFRVKIPNSLSFYGICFNEQIHKSLGIIAPEKDIPSIGRSVDGKAILAFHADNCFRAGNSMEVIFGGNLIKFCGGADFDDSFEVNLYSLSAEKYLEIYGEVHTIGSKGKNGNILVSRIKRNPSQPGQDLISKGIIISEDILKMYTLPEGPETFEGDLGVLKLIRANCSDENVEALLKSNSDTIPLKNKVRSHYSSGKRFNVERFRKLDSFKNMKTFTLEEEILEDKKLFVPTIANLHDLMLIVRSNLSSGHTSSRVELRAAVVVFKEILDEAVIDYEVAGKIEDQKKLEMASKIYWSTLSKLKSVDKALINRLPRVAIRNGKECKLFSAKFGVKLEYGVLILPEGKEAMFGGLLKSKLIGLLTSSKTSYRAKGEETRLLNNNGVEKLLLLLGYNVYESKLSTFKDRLNSEYELATFGAIQKISVNNAKQVTALKNALRVKTPSECAKRFAEILGDDTQMVETIKDLLTLQRALGDTDYNEVVDATVGVIQYFIDHNTEDRVETLFQSIALGTMLQIGLSEDREFTSNLHFFEKNCRMVVEICNAVVSGEELPEGVNSNLEITDSMGNRRGIDNLAAMQGLAFICRLPRGKAYVEGKQHLRGAEWLVTLKNGASDTIDYLCAKGLAQVINTLFEERI